MNDPGLVERLRFAVKDPAGTDTHVAIYRDLCAEAAAEIERLRAALRGVRVELDEEEGYHDGNDSECEVCRAIKIIDAALSGKGES
jgi:hypothetical protein